MFALINVFLIAQIKTDKKLKHQDYFFNNFLVFENRLQNSRNLTYFILKNANLYVEKHHFRVFNELNQMVFLACFL